MNLLMIDDDHCILEVFESIIQQCSLCQAWTASNVEQAKKIIDNNSIDLVITDWSMPNQSAVIILQYCQMKKITAIISSGYPKEEIEKIKQDMAILKEINVIDKLDCFDYLFKIIKGGS